MAGAMIQVHSLGAVKRRNQELMLQFSSWRFFLDIIWIYLLWIKWIVGISPMIRWCFSLKFLILNMLLSLLAHTNPSEKKNTNHCIANWHRRQDLGGMLMKTMLRMYNVCIVRKNHDASSLSISIWLVNLPFKQSTLHINLNYFPVEFLKEGRLGN